MKKEQILKIVQKHGDPISLKELSKKLDVNYSTLLDNINGRRSRDGSPTLKLQKLIIENYFDAAIDVLGYSEVERIMDTTKGLKLRKRIKTKRKTTRKNNVPSVKKEGQKPIGIQKEKVGVVFDDILYMVARDLWGQLNIKKTIEDTLKDKDVSPVVFEAIVKSTISIMEKK